MIIKTLCYGVRYFLRKPMNSINSLDAKNEPSGYNFDYREKYIRGRDLILTESFQVV